MIRDGRGFDPGPNARGYWIWVVKLGGSLADSPFFSSWMDVLSSSPAGRIVIVPGGGVFADQVRAGQRQWKFDDRTAHRMALLAMQQYGLMLTSFLANCPTAGNVPEIRAVLRNSPLTVWMPDIRELDRAGIPSSWAATSDSLAAWLAGQLGSVRLGIVKSSPQATLLAGPDELAKQGILDTAFPAIWKKSGVPLKIYHKGDYPAFAADLDREFSSERAQRCAMDSGSWNRA